MTSQYKGVWILFLILTIFINGCGIHNQAVASKKIVGLWVSKVVEQGVEQTILLHLLIDGKSKYQFIDKDGMSEETGTWNYKEGVLYEQFSDGSTGKGSIKWISKNEFEITIIDNGDPRYDGVKRVYKRKLYTTHGIKK